MKYLILTILATLVACNNSTPPAKVAETPKGAMHDYTTIIPKTKANLDAALNVNTDKLKESEETKE